MEESIICQCGRCGAKNRIDSKKQHLGPKCGKCGSALDIVNQSVPVVLTDATMDSFLASASLPVLVDFFSPTCGPCQALAPLYAQLTRQYFGRIILAKVDTSVNPGCAAHYRIRGVPTLIFFKNRQVVDQLVGLPDQATLKAKLDVFARPS